jgi:hypothetical protein
LSSIPFPSRPGRAPVRYSAAAAPPQWVGAAGSERTARGTVAARLPPPVSPPWSAVRHCGGNGPPQRRWTEECSSTDGRLNERGSVLPQRRPLPPTSLSFSLSISLCLWARRVGAGGNGGSRRLVTAFGHPVQTAFGHRAGPGRAGPDLDWREAESGMRLCARSHAGPRGRDWWSPVLHQ